jgi:hypothetical protein
MFKGVFTGSLLEAKAINAEQYYWDSHQENVFCKKTIEWMIAHRFDGKQLRYDCAYDLCSLFGVERVAWVLANTILESLDERIGRGNIEWASNFLFPVGDEDPTEEYCVGAPAILVGDLAWQLRAYCLDHEILGYSECDQESAYSDYSNKLLIIAPGSLKDAYRTEKYQYFYVDHYERDSRSGEAIIQGRNLANGFNATLSDCNILGVADEKQIPGEVKKKLAKFRREHNAKLKAKEGTNENQGISNQPGTGSPWHTVSELRRYVEERRANRPQHL